MFFDENHHVQVESKGRIAVLDDDSSSNLVIERLLKRNGFDPVCSADPSKFIDVMLEVQPEAVLLDLHLPGYSGMEMLTEVRRVAPTVPVIMLTADDKASSVVSAMRSGAYDYLTKPIEPERLLLTVGHAVMEGRLAERVAALERPDGTGRFGILLGRSNAMAEVFRELKAVATQDVPVLLRGETGVGKARAARAIHLHSRRFAKPFVELNLATTPEPQQAAALFGYGRPNGRSAAARRGLLDHAASGTLLLRDITELGPVAQAGLLRVLERKSFLRMGGGADVPCDVRILAATSKDLSAEVAAGRFREALYFRLAVFDLRLPPLRERFDDVMPLATELLREHAGAVDLKVSEAAFSPDAVDALLAYEWPGNVRELSNAVQRAMIASGGRLVESAHLPAYVRPGSADQNPSHGVTVEQALPVESLEDLERRAILGAMGRHGGNAAAVARELKIGRATLYRKLRAYGGVGVSAGG